MELLLVAEVVKSHGLKGEVCIDSHADSPFSFDGVSSLYLQSKGQKPRRFVVQSFRRHKGRALVIFKGINDRDKADTLRGMDVLVQKEDLPELRADEVYMYQLKNAAVELEDGTAVGTISDFLFAPGQETWVISSPEGKEILFPAVAGFVLSVDVEAGKIVIAPPEGLLELYMAAPIK